MINITASKLFKLSTLCMAMAAAPQVQAFSQAETGSVGDSVWYDTDKDGIKDATEQGVPFVTLSLNDCGDGRELQTTQTDAQGNYQIGYIDPGQSVRVQVYPDSNYDYDGAVFSTFRAGSDTLKDNNGQVLVGATENVGASQCFNTKAGVKTNGLDFGISLNPGTPTDSGSSPQPNPPAAKLAQIGDRVFTDNNNNGVFDTGDTGIQGAVVTFYDASDNVVATSTSNNQGLYLVEVPAGCYKAVLTSLGGIDTSTVLYDGTIDNICVDVGETDRSIDFPVVNKAAPANAIIGDQVYYDNNSNGSFDSGDTGLSYATVTAYDSSDQVVASDTASTSGQYSLQLPAGCYKVVVSLPSGIDTSTVTYTDTQNNVCVTAGQKNNNIDFAVVKNPVVAWTLDKPTSCVINLTHYSRRYYKKEHYFATLSFTPAPTQAHIRDLNVYGNGALVAQDRQTITSGTNLQPTSGPLGFKSAKSSTSRSIGSSAYVRTDTTLSTPIGSTPNAQQLKLWSANSIAFVNSNGEESTHLTCSVKKTARSISSPVALDLNGDGQIGVSGESTAQLAHRESVNYTTQFDYGNGEKVATEWLMGDGDAVLVDNRDGMAASEMDGSRLFGDENGKFANGYDKLALLDVNGDGVLTNAELTGLELWLDDGDAIVQSGELQSLGAHGIASIGTQMSLVDGMMRSTATKTDGSTVMTEDVWFATAPIAATAASPTIAPVKLGLAMLLALLATLGTAVGLARKSSVKAKVS